MRPSTCSTVVTRLRLDPDRTIRSFADLAGIEHERIRLWIFARAAAERETIGANDDLVVTRTIHRSIRLGSLGQLTDPPQTQPLKRNRGRWGLAPPVHSPDGAGRVGQSVDSGVATRERASAPTYRPPRHLLDSSRAAIGSLPAHRVRICYSRLQPRRCLPPSSFIVFGSSGLVPGPSGAGSTVAGDKSIRVSEQHYGQWSKITLRKPFAHPYRHSRRIV